MTVGAVADRPAGNATKANLVELIPLAFFVVSRIHEMRAIRKAGSYHVIWITLAEKATKHVKNARQHMGARGECRWFQRFQNGAGRNAHINMIVKAIIEHDLGVKDIDQIDADEHFEHLLIEEHID